MKGLLLACVFVFLISSCGGNDSGKEMIVEGNVKGLKKGVLYLQHISDSTLVTLDSLEIKGDGNFRFSTELESPEIFYLYLSKKDANEINDRITFFGEPGTIRILTEWNRFDTNAKISGSEAHAKLEEYRQVMTRFNSQNLEILQAAYKPEIQADSLALDSIARLSNRNVLRGYLYALNFALNNKNSHIAPYIAVSEVADANRVYLDSIYNSLSPEVAESKYGRELRQLLDEKKAE